MTTQGLSEMRDWVNGDRKSNDFLRHAALLVHSAEEQESDLGIAYRLLNAVLRADVMGPAWVLVAKRLIGKGEVNASLRKL